VKEDSGVEEEDEEDSAEIAFLEHKLDEDIHPTRAAYLHDGRYSMTQLDLECSCK